MSLYDRIGDAIGIAIFILGWSAIAAGLIAAFFAWRNRNGAP